MAHASSMVMAQEPIRCELCTRSTEPVKVYCNTCNMKLCKSCMSSHVSQGHRSHDMVEYAYHGSNAMCEIHSGNRCEMKCQQCQIPVCTKCIISGIHKNHDFSDIFGESGDLGSVAIGANIQQSFNFLRDPVVVLEVESNCVDLDRIGICHPDKIWTSFMYENTISCLDFSGSIIDSLSISSGEYPADLFVTKEKEIYLCDWKDKTINKQSSNVKNRDIEVLLKLEEWTPRAICISKSGNLLVCMTVHFNSQCKIVQYDRESIVQEIQFNENGDALFHHKGGDIFLAENGNGDICVSLPAHRSVQVVNNAGDFRYSYHGDTDTVVSDNFSPHGVTTDRLHQVLIADSENNRIHCIDAEGHFIKHICCDLVDPRAVQVNAINNNLYVGEFRTGKIKIIKYIQ